MEQLNTMENVLRKRTALVLWMEKHIMRVHLLSRIVSDGKTNMCSFDTHKYVSQKRRTALSIDTIFHIDSPEVQLQISGLLLGKLNYFIRN